MPFLGKFDSSRAGSSLKVLLVYPPARLSAPPRVPPMGYLYLGSVLEDAGIQVEILDLNLHRAGIDQVVSEIDRRDFHVVGIGGMTTVYYYIKLLSLLLKERYPALPIVGGGTACSASPGIVLTKTGVDVVCIGEGEPVIADLVTRLAKWEPVSDIPGLAYRTASGEVAHTASRPRFEGWSGMIPAHHLVDMETYIANNAVKYAEVPGLRERVDELGVDPVKASRPVHVFSKRGCPFGCTFCYRNFGRKVVYDAPDAVVRYLEHLEETYNTAHFVFGDELFNVDHRWVTDFCDLIISRQKRYVFSTSNGLRANCITEDRLLQMKAAGFYRIGIGIESFYDPSLRAMKKNQKAREIFNAIMLARRVGLHLGEGGLLFGYETDGWDAMRANVEALTKLGHFRTGFAVPCPYPGTYLYENAVEQGFIEDEEGWLIELADLDVAKRAINMSGRSVEELKEIIQWGVDQLAVNSVKVKYPRTGRALDVIQPLLRRVFGLDAVGIAFNLKRRQIGDLTRSLTPNNVRVWTRRILDGLSIAGTPEVTGLSGGGDRYLVVEALSRLQRLTVHDVRPLEFLRSGPTDSDLASQEPGRRGGVGDRAAS